MNVIPLSIEPSDLIRSGEVTKDEFEFYIDDLYDEAIADGKAQGESCVASESYDDGYEAGRQSVMWSWINGG